MPPVWYYRQGGREYGPITESELRRLASQGDIRPTDHLWREGSPHWTPAHSVKDLFPTPPPFSASDDAAGISDQARTYARGASRDALQAMKLLAFDPVGGLAQGYEELGPARAEKAGVAFLLIYVVGVVVDSFSLSRRMLAMIGEPLNRSFEVHYNGPLALGIMSGILPPTVALGACWLARRFTRLGGSWRSDLFLIGAAFFPLGISNTLVGLFGVDRFHVISAIGVVAQAWQILVLFVGFTKILAVSERAAAYAIAAVLVVSLWLGSLLHWFFPGP